MKNIWIVNYYTDTPGNVSNTRHYEFAKYLTAQGYQVRVFFADRKRKPERSADLYNGQKYYNEECENIKYTHIAVQPYMRAI